MLLNDASVISSRSMLSNSIVPLCFTILTSDLTRVDFLDPFFPIIATL